MKSFITVAEAASYLGISKATLRNWDREGKLKAHRHPLNGYRVYDLEELRHQRSQFTLFAESGPVSDFRSKQQTATDVRSVKRAVAKLHAVLRDVDGNTSLLHRFDELTKLLFLKLIAEKTGINPFAQQAGESVADYVYRVRTSYSTHASAASALIPVGFSVLNATDDAIRQCGIVLEALSFRGASFDVKGLAYEEVIRGTFDKSDHQQFFTPHQVVTFMVQLMRPYIKGTVGDPACGTAGFLAEILRCECEHEHLIGLEIDDRLGWVAGINLLLHGGQRFDIKVLGNGGTLGDGAKAFQGSLDTILTNPPFGSDLSDSQILDAFVLGRGRTSRRRGILFLERCWELLKPGGVVAIIIDEGVLSQSTTEDVRTFLLERFDVLAVISLPESTFMPYATVSSSILVLRRSEGRPANSRVFYARAENVGRKPNGDDDVNYDSVGEAKLRSDLPTILTGWEAFLAGRATAPNDLTFEVDFSKTVVASSGHRIDVRFQDPARQRSSQILDSHTSLVPLIEICSERNESVIPSEASADPVILYTGLADIEARTGLARQIPTPAASLKSAVKRYEPGDVIFAKMRPNLRKVAHMKFEEGGFASSECVVLTVRRTPDGSPMIDPELLAALLRSDLVYGQIGHLISGIGRPRLNVTDLRQIRLPNPNFMVQRRAKHEFDAMLRMVSELRAKVEALESEANELQRRSVEVVSERLLEGEPQR